MGSLISSRISHYGMTWSVGYSFEDYTEPEEAFARRQSYVHRAAHTDAGDIFILPVQLSCGLYL